MKLQQARYLVPYMVFPFESHDRERYGETGLLAGK